MTEPLRADKWLWATRFFKTRGQAVTACNAGKVRRGGNPLKPATSIHPGDVLEIPFIEGPGSRTVEVKDLPGRRLSAPLARLCYVDHTDPAVIERLKGWLAEKREAAKGRPTKKDRREIGRIRGFFE